MSRKNLAQKCSGNFSLQSFVSCRPFRNSATYSTHSYFPYNASDIQTNNGSG